MPPSDTLGGLTDWTVVAPRDQTVEFRADGVQLATQPADRAGVAMLALDTTLLANGSNSLAVTRW